jgi:hypothetical protein
MDEKTFIDPENNKLIYKARAENLDLESTSDFWLKFISNDRKFIGKPPRNLFYTSLRIEVTASDGFTEAKDSFVL